MMTYPGDHDAEAVLSEFWEANAPDELDTESEWPGMAPTPSMSSPDAPDALAAAVADQFADPGEPLARLRVALVPAAAALTYRRRRGPWPPSTSRSARTTSTSPR
ncbi:hypothetical protein [Streptomyces sp. NBC_00057]|uniref:hypothetical protein n=1 Tax=Streptomyces sp. NBC_00057 TaxID=2975634 RepID=UPI003243B0D5